MNNKENRFQFPPCYPNAVTPWDLYRAGSADSRLAVKDAAKGVKERLRNSLNNAGLQLNNTEYKYNEIIKGINQRFPGSAPTVRYLMRRGAIVGLSAMFYGLADIVSDGILDGNFTPNDNIAHAADSQPCSSVDPSQLNFDPNQQTGFVNICTDAGGVERLYYPPTLPTAAPEASLPPPFSSCYNPELVKEVVEVACNKVEEIKYPCVIEGEKGPILNHLIVQEGADMQMPRNLVQVSDTGAVYPLGTVDKITGGDMVQARDARCEFLPVADGGSEELTSLPTPVVNGQSGLPPTPLQGVEQNPWGFFDNVGYYAKGTFTGLKYMLSVGVPSWIIWKFAQRRTGRIQAEQNEARITDAEVARDRRILREAARQRELEARIGNNQNNN